MKFKELVRLGILAGTIAVGALIAINFPKVVDAGKQGTIDFFNQFASPEVASEVVSEITSEITSPYQDAHEKFETGQIANVPESAVQCTVKRVIDGDTYVVDLGGKETKLRLIGVDTPESVASDEYLEQSGKDNTDYGKKVSDAMKDKIPVGSTLFVVTDVMEMDKYGRTLGYVYFEDGEMVQDYLLKNGYAKLMTVQPNVQFVEHFIELEQKAMDEGVGIWQDYEAAFGGTKEGEQEEDLSR